MSTAVHKTTFQVIEDANTPEYISPDWLINPDMSKVQGVDKKYWFLNDGKLDQMNSDLKRKIDDAEIDNLKQVAIKKAKSDLISSYDDGFEFPANSGKRINLSESDRMMLQGIIALGMESIQYPISIPEVGGGTRNLLNKNDVSSLVQSEIIHKLHLKKSCDELVEKIKGCKTAEDLRKVV